MHEIETWIEDAARKLSLSIDKLPPEDANAVRNKAMSMYVAVPDPRVWWLNLKDRPDEHHDTNTVELSKVLPTQSGCVYLIPDDGSATSAVYRVEASELETLLDDCPIFEYNVLSLDFSWLLMETHHDQFYICRYKRLDSATT